MDLNHKWNGWLNWLSYVSYPWEMLQLHISFRYFRCHKLHPRDVLNPNIYTCCLSMFVYYKHVIHTCTSLAEFPSTFWSEVWRCYNLQTNGSMKTMLTGSGRRPIDRIYLNIPYSVYIYISYMVRGVITSTCLWFAKVHTLHVWKELPFCPFGIAFCLSGGRCGVCRWGPELMQTWWQVPIVDHRTAAASSCLAALTSAPGVFVFAAIKEHRSCQGKAWINRVWRKTSFLLARHDHSHRASKLACAGLRQHWTLALFDFCWWVYSKLTMFEPNSCAFKASCNPRCCWRLLESIYVSHCPTFVFVQSLCFRHGSLNTPVSRIYIIRTHLVALRYHKASKHQKTPLHLQTSSCFTETPNKTEIHHSLKGSPDGLQFPLKLQGFP